MLTLQILKESIQNHKTILSLEPELTVSERSQIIGLLKGGHTRKEISDILGFY
ncbi:10900_t:CDS:2 [Entrophospora sp. SA101]|nr:10900_t:CDS:2 [Entrophospora sp. SA101]